MMRDSIKILFVALSLTGVACGGSSSKDLGKFVGVWGAPSGTFVETCPGNPSGGGTSQVTDTETWSLGSTSDLVQTIPGTTCVFHADVSGDTASESPSGQMCTVNSTLANGDSLTAVLTITAYRFVVSSDDLTANETYSGTEQDTDNTTLESGNCTFTQTASYMKE
jgi:hypothetical protein